jgi:hypothetical protein
MRGVSESPKMRGMNDPRIFADDVEGARVARGLAAAHPDAAPANLAQVEPEDPSLARVRQEDLHWRCEFAWKIFAQNQALIAATDQKTYMLIVMSTLLISLGSANIDRFVLGPFARQVALSLLVASAVVFFLLALVTLLARGSKHAPGESRSLVYFAHIAEAGSEGAYNSRFASASQTELMDDLLEQLTHVSHILTKKMRNYRHCWIGAIGEVVIFLSIVLIGHVIH